MSFRPTKGHPSATQDPLRTTNCSLGQIDLHRLIRAIAGQQSVLLDRNRALSGQHRAWSGQQRIFLGHDEAFLGQSQACSPLRPANRTLGPVQGKLSPIKGPSEQQSQQSHNTFKGPPMPSQERRGPLCAEKGSLRPETALCRPKVALFRPIQAFRLSL